MKQFMESNINFHFDETYWNICNYDAIDGDYRKNVHLPETKAVDFVGIYQQNSIVFFEVKSFRGYGNQTNVQSRLNNSMEELSTEIARKVRDTVAVIAGLNRTVKHNPFWRETEAILSDSNDIGKPIMVIAWVEEDHSKQNKTEMVTRLNKLKQRLSWLTSAVYIENVKEQYFKFEGFEANL
ncbi:MAG: hypothetical protein LBQ28_03980 [Prevotellaceae bacterium]|jgi:hypothetical protein|nr:hypothetical protein [Prevotellaceae bacterium]